MLLKNLRENKEFGKAKCGVYIIKVNEQIIYVGESVDLRKRFLTHLRFAEEPRKARTQKALYHYLNRHLDIVEIGYKEVEQNMLYRTEAALIKKYRPRFCWDGVRVQYGWRTHRDY